MAVRIFTVAAIARQIYRLAVQPPKPHFTPDIIIMMEIERAERH